MIETFTEIVSDPELRASLSKKIDTLVGHLSLFPIKDKTDDERALGVRVFRELLERYLLRQPTPLQLLKRQHQKIEFTIAGGQKILVYDPNPKITREKTASTKPSTPIKPASAKRQRRQ
jgi:hypothetical protein